MGSYSDKLKDPRWQKKRLEILSRDNFACRFCNDDSSSLNVHHLAYVGEPWEAPDKCLITLCEDCHKEESEDIIEAEKNLIKQLKLCGFSSVSMNALSKCFLKDMNWANNEFNILNLKDFIEDEEVFENFGIKKWQNKRKDSENA